MGTLETTIADAYPHACPRLRKAFADATREQAHTHLVYEVATSVYWHARDVQAWCRLNDAGDARERAANAYALALAALCDDVVGAI